jgi:hypothetical protein
MQIRLGAILVLLLLTSGCGSSMMEYTPQPCENYFSAEKTIKRVILAQPGTNAPVDVAIADEYIKVLCRKSRRGPGVGYVTGNVVIAGPQTEYAAAPVMIYFQYVGEIQLYKRHDYFVVMIFDRSGAYRYRVITYMLDEAKSFIDALNYVVNDFKNRTK